MNELGNIVLSSQEIRQTINRLKRRFDLCVSIQRPRGDHDWHLVDFDQQLGHDLPPVAMQVEVTGGNCYFQLPEVYSGRLPTHVLRMKGAASFPLVDFAKSQRGKSLRSTPDHNVDHARELPPSLAAAAAEHAGSGPFYANYELDPATATCRVDLLVQGTVSDAHLMDNVLQVPKNLKPRQRLFVDIQEHVPGRKRPRHHVRGFPAIELKDTAQLPNGFLWWGGSTNVSLSPVQEHHLEFAPLPYASLCFAPAEHRQEMVAQTEFELLPVTWDPGTEGWCCEGTPLNDDALAILFAAESTSDRQPTGLPSSAEADSAGTRNANTVDDRLRQLRQMAGVDNDHELIEKAYFSLLSWSDWEWWEDAEDALADAIGYVLKKVVEGKQFNDWNHALNYLACNVGHQRVSQKRRERRQRGLHDRARENLEMSGPTAMPLDDGPLEQLLPLLQSVPPGKREAVVLHRLEGWTYKEVGEFLGVNEDTARARDARVIRNLNPNRPR